MIGTIGRAPIGTIGARLRGRGSGVLLELSSRHAFTVRDGRMVSAEGLT